MMSESQASQTDIATKPARLARQVETPRTRLTRHAIERLAERSRLDHLGLADILDNLSGKEKTICIGREHGRSHRRSILFYSKVDKQCFVAVQDERNLEVITVMPPDFRGRAKVPLEAIRELTEYYEEVPGILDRSWDLASLGGASAETAKLAEWMVFGKNNGRLFRVIIYFIKMGKVTRIRRLKFEMGEYGDGKDNPKLLEAITEFAITTREPTEGCFVTLRTKRDGKAEPYLKANRCIELALRMLKGQE